MIVVVDYIGNLGSVLNMLKRIGVDARSSSDPEVVAEADRVILPGVGAYRAGMESLEQQGLVPALRHAAMERRVPFLGFCLGMQLLVDGSDEGDGTAAGLGWIPGWCQRLEPISGLRVPQMGWNRIETLRSHYLVEDLPPGSRFYFVHTFEVKCEDSDDVVAVADYGGTVSAVIARDNVVGTQFHPEKSHKFGLALLTRFADTSIRAAG
jgi:glutamine amidotransferase